MARFLTVPAIQAFLDPTFGAMTPTRAIAPDVGLIAGLSNGTHQLSLFNFFTGELVSAQDLPSIGVSAEVTNLGHAIIIAPDSTLWLKNGDNSGGVGSLCQLVPGSPWTVKNSWGAFGDIPTGFPDAVDIAYISVGNGNWVLNGPRLSPFITVFQADAPGQIGFWGHEFDTATASHPNQLCVGPQGPSTSTAYWLSDGFEGGPWFVGSTMIKRQAYTYSPADWPTPNAAITSAIIKTYAPTDIDPAWTALTAMYGPAYDATDGNLVMGAQGTGSANGNYIIKANASTGAVMWKTAITGGAVWSMDRSLRFSRIANGIFYVYVQNSTFGATIWAINTNDGSVTTQTITGILSIQFPASDDVLGAFIGQPNWDAGEGDLRLLGATASSGSTLGVVYIAAVAPLPQPPGAVSHTRFWMSP